MICLKDDSDYCGYTNEYGHEKKGKLWNSPSKCEGNFYYQNSMKGH